MGRDQSTEKEAEIVRLYTDEKLGAKAIRRYFNGRPCRSTIIKILLKHGVYRGEEAACKPDEQRRERVLLDERERRRRLAGCLRALRNGESVEGICREHGWNVRSIWNHLRTLPAYHAVKRRQKRKYPDQIKARRDGLWLSQQYPKERRFQEVIREILDDAGCSYSVEPSIKGLRVRGDFLIDSVMIECKVDVSHIGMTKALGQCWFYQTHTPHSCMLVVPDDVVPHEAWVAALRRMGATLLNESGFRCWVRGELSFSQIQLRSYARTRSGVF
jgi:hypothetical protein